MNAMELTLLDKKPCGILTEFCIHAANKINDKHKFVILTGFAQQENLHR